MRIHSALYILNGQINMLNLHCGRQEITLSHHYRTYVFLRKQFVGVPTPEQLVVEGCTDVRSEPDRSGSPFSTTGLRWTATSMNSPTLGALHTMPVERTGD